MTELEGKSQELALTILLGRLPELSQTEQRRFLFSLGSWIEASGRSRRERIVEHMLSVLLSGVSFRQDRGDAAVDYARRCDIVDAYESIVKPNVRDFALAEINVKTLLCDGITEQQLLDAAAAYAKHCGKGQIPHTARQSAHTFYDKTKGLYWRFLPQQTPERDAGSSGSSPVTPIDSTAEKERVAQRILEHYSCNVRRVIGDLAAIRETITIWLDRGFEEHHLRQAIAIYASRCARSLYSESARARCEEFFDSENSDRMVFFTAVRYGLITR